ncbi:hypothetical protein SS37A_28870 [Methylocystis iwaonis]|uniref:Uncharacterized protein n=1 Tax=Methylocystis iwaonis TaxID=2885079 RepID=A0ABM8EBH8_9HYPH|nr:hypothetical protein SS37A_28870 [Methylocystis iwaonis]
MAAMGARHQLQDDRGLAMFSGANDEAFVLPFHSACSDPRCRKNDNLIPSPYGARESHISGAVMAGLVPAIHAEGHSPTERVIAVDKVHAGALP